jgi:signal transduction histidine kinase
VTAGPPPDQDQDPDQDRRAGLGRAGSRVEAERGPVVLSRGVLAVRWVALAWMVTLALAVGHFRHPQHAWAAVAVTALWTLWRSLGRAGARASAWNLIGDLVIGAGLTVLSGTVVPVGQVAGERAFFATVYPATAALSWGLAWGIGGGLAAGAVLALALVSSRTANDVALGTLSGSQLINLASGAVNYLLAGGVVGFVAQLLERSAGQVRAADQAAMQASEEAARLAEREALAREIHDSVLQTLALLHKRGRELAGQAVIPCDEVARLAELAGSQEATLCALILRPAGAESGGPARDGLVSLRDALERVARGVESVPVMVSAVGPAWLPAATVAELAAAVTQALHNVAEHARASRATVFVDTDADEQGGAEGGVTVTVRDDGAGFRYDEAALRAAGSIGLLGSMKGRVEQLGGTMRVETAPGAGTEVEFRLPPQRSRQWLGRDREPA